MYVLYIAKRFLYEYVIKNYFVMINTNIRHINDVRV